MLEDQIETSGPIEGEPTGPLFDMLKDSINRFKNVIKDLTDVAKVQRDLDGAAEKIHFADILSDVKVNIKDLLKKDNAAIQVDFNEAPQINFSRKNLYSILYNLISNAIKYRSPDRRPQVSIKTELLDGFVRLTVQDNGLGISKDNLPKMFTLFKRFHSHVEGTGMGLYIVKRLMDNAGGSIEVESKEGKGTTLKLYFNTELEVKESGELEEKLILD